MRTKFISTILSVATLVSCGERQPKSPPLPYAPHFLRLGAMRLVEWNSAGELLDTAPRLFPDFHAQPSNVATPQFALVQGERPVAEFIPTPWRAGTLKAPEPYHPPELACPSEPLLGEIVEELSAIAMQKDMHSSIHRELASLSNCQLQPILRCFLQKIRAKDWSHFSTRLARGTALKSIIASLDSCSGSEGNWKTEPYFEIRGKLVRFSPDSLYSIRIFKGAFSSYTYANDNFDSTAKLLNIKCLGDCFASPQPLKDFYACESCRELERGQQYTAFLQLSRAENEENFIPILFRFP